MKVEQREGGVNISNIQELSAANARYVRDAIVTTLKPDMNEVDIDLSETLFVDSCGIGALVSVYREISKRNGRFRVIHPTTRVAQILELTQMGQLFTIVKRH
jgi:anti-anti-sigma factor